MLNRQQHMRLRLTRCLLRILTLVCACCLQLAGWICDKGVGRVTSTMWVTVVAGVCVCKDFALPHCLFFVACMQHYSCST